jgi:hypothetical protein
MFAAAPPSRATAAALALTTALAVVLALAGCAYRGRDDALSQRFTWFSYLNGDDIRAACVPGAVDRFRFVYNGVYIQQARTYDIAPRADGTGYLLRARVLGPSDLSDVGIDPWTIVDDPLDLLAPFAGRKSSTPLDGRDIDALAASLTQSGFFQPAPSGLYLRSEDFFWVGVACISGRMAFNAWRWPSSRFEALTFPRLLLSWDQTGIPVNPPRNLAPFDIYGQTSPDGKFPQFSLTVGADGFRGVGTLF